MCGIFGYIGPSDDPKRSANQCLSGLKKLEYRGYDSSGLAGIIDGKIKACKQVGKVALLEKLLKTASVPSGATIAHTRWATHGKASQENAHPHFDPEQSLAIVHNGIIENFLTLKQSLVRKSFETETDSEVIAHLIAQNYQGDLLNAVRQTASLLIGSYALAVVHKDHPDEIIACAFESPLAIGIGQDECFVASDANAFKGQNVSVLFLSHGEMAKIGRGSCDIYDANGKIVQREPLQLDLQDETLSKNGFDHFMLKEIHEQPITLAQTLEGRYSDEFGTAQFHELPASLQKVKRVIIVGCGTSWHAGLLGASLFESLARVFCQAEIASEFRYTNPIIDQHTLIIAISQSGETADTLAAVRESKAKGAKVIGLCNAPHSTLTREANYSLFLRAGQEISVCSTKAFTSQLMTLALLALHLGRQRHLSKEAGQIFLDELKQIPLKVRQVLAHSACIEKYATKYSSYQDFFFLGRRYMYPASLEAALKLKEISYLNAIAYPAGEMKHGPIALVGPALSVIALSGNDQTKDKLLSNLMEVKARGSPILIFANEGETLFDDVATDCIYLPSTCDELASIPYSVALQLFAYFIAKEKGTDIDQPRNLAKSVTVE